MPKAAKKLVMYNPTTRIEYALLPRSASSHFVRNLKFCHMTVFFSTGINRDKYEVCALVVARISLQVFAGTEEVVDGSICRCLQVFTSICRSICRHGGRSGRE